MFFDTWSQLLKIVVSGSLAYLGLVIMLRFSGKRTLAQLNAFDFVVTVAFGSTLATIILSKDTTLVEGLVALGLLVLLQFLVAWSYTRVKFINKLVKSEPTLLFYQGTFKTEAIQKSRLEKEELLQAARSQGILSLQQIEAIVLETNGKLSIIKTSENSDRSTLQNVDLD